MHYRHHYRYKHHGFSLLELCIVVIIIGVMVASILPAITHMKGKEQQEELKRNMDIIEHAIMAYQKKNNRLPCPAQVALNTDNANFGIEAATPGTCTGGTPTATSPATNAVMGLVPVRSLSLPDSMAFDPWGRAYTYAADTRMTSVGAFTTHPVDDTTVGSITIRARDEINDTLSNTTTKSIMIVLSHGVNGHGAYLPSGQRYISSTIGPDELENCNCDASGAAGTLNAIFVKTFQRKN